MMDLYVQNNYRDDILSDCTLQIFWLDSFSSKLFFLGST